MKTSRNSPVVAAVLALVVASCGGGGETSGSTATDSRTTEAPTTDAPSTEAPSTEAPTTEAPVDADPVTLLDPGAEPRAELRLVTEPGTYDMTIAQGQQITQTFGGATQPTISSNFEMVMRNDVSIVDEGFEIISTITSARAAKGTPAQQRAAVNAALAQLVGVRTIAVMDDRGIVASAEVDDESLAGVDPTLATTMTQLTENSNLAAPLPLEPVGIGARWSIEQNLLASGVNILQTVEYKLTGRDANTVVLEVRVSQRPVETTIQIAGVPGDVEIVEWTSTGSGTTRLDLTDPVPTSRIEVKARQVLGTSQGDLTQEIVSRTDISPTSAE